MDAKMVNHLKAKTAIEMEQLKTHRFVADIPDYARKDQVTDFVLQKGYFFNNKDVYISKHNRYADYPLHTHEFLEINYMMSGHCRQIVDGQPIELRTHDLLLLDIGCRHEIKELGDNDILINILFRNKNISISWLNNLKRSNSLLYDFLLNTSYGKKNRSNFIIFNNRQNARIVQTIDALIEEYLNKQPYYNAITSSYLNILLTQLVRYYRLKQPKRLSSSQSLVIKVLQDMERDYADLTLEQEAKKYSYNKNYLSNLLKKETGKSFNVLLTQQRIMNAHVLLTSTASNIRDIMYRVGMTNKTFFYKKYKEYYHELPGETRQNSTNESPYSF
ncbi:helix-turn-helix domain-containing protein [Sporolactobacillus sp. THM7-7]|nr:helix-turn-helix domain-containing protein [Sporolactobacillus sp. THM7-7]